jgi:hypothetical protein
MYVEMEIVAGLFNFSSQLCKQKTVKIESEALAGLCCARL